MPAVPALINLNFNSYYAGAHRICFREVTIPATGYDCVSVAPVICTGGGAPCSASIPITVNNETCDPVTYEGYVQPVCEDELSTDARTYWTVSFVPSPPCKKYTVQCVAGTVDVQINNPGKGYPAGTTIPLVFSGGGGGAGADFDATIGNGGVKTFTLSSGGGGYAGGASGTYSMIAPPGGSGGGATFEVVLTAGVVTSAYLMVTSPFTSPGTGYTIGDVLNIGPILGTGAGATITVNTLNTGEVQYLTLNNAGSGYTLVPTAVIPAAATTPATFNITVTCNSDAPIGNCDGDAVTLNDSLGGLIYVCNSVAPSPPVGYNVTEAGCCYSCVGAVFTNDGLTTQTIYYIECNTLSQESITLLAGASSTLLCVVDDSWYQLEGSDISVATTPTCALL